MPDPDSGVGQLLSRTLACRDIKRQSVVSRVVEGGANAEARTKVGRAALQPRTEGAGANPMLRLKVPNPLFAAAVTKDAERAGREASAVSVAAGASQSA